MVYYRHNIKPAPNASIDNSISFTKEREDVRDIVDELESTISIDSLHHNEADRFFLECEVIVNQDSAFAAREMLKRWASTTFEVDTSKEAPSMIDIVNSSNEEL